MKIARKSMGLAALVALGLCGVAHAGFGGQTILGPITLSSDVSGDLTGKSDDNDGWFSGDHVFDIWDGGDDVWQLNWPGGDMRLLLTYDTAQGDPDLFLYTPGSLDESSYDSFTNTGLEQIDVAAAPAGTYYVLVDTTAGQESPYRLQVIPAPGVGMVAAGAGAMFLRRRR